MHSYIVNNTDTDRQTCSNIVADQFFVSLLFSSFIVIHTILVLKLTGVTMFEKSYLQGM